MDLRGILVSALTLALSCSAQAIVVGQLDDFQDGTTQNWTNGGVQGVPPIVNLDGGPGGAGDRFIQVTSLGGQGAGNRLTVFNRDQWLGDYIDQGVTSIELDLRNFSNVQLSIRIAFKQETGPVVPGYVSQAFILAPNSGWVHAVFSLSMAAMIPIDSPVDYNTFFSGDFQEARIINSINPDLNGEPIAAQIGIDNIHAVPEPTVFTLVAIGVLPLASSIRRRSKHG
jgi:hypothetical protein